MRTLVAFLLGLIIGGLTMMYLPDQRRGELNKQLNQQIETLQSQVRGVTKTERNTVTLCFT
jgi:uncharacterized membrane-anchored protein YhcB (DUF1043 family)